MSDEVLVLAATAAAVGFIHTLMGPDHYVPFLVLARARAWSLGRTLAVTAVCGIGHVLSSVLLGTVGIAAGIAVSRLEAVETARADLAGWLLVTFGLLYMTWGLSRALRHSGHRHLGFPSRRQLAVHDPFRADHDHEPPTPEAGGYRLTPWVLFVVFVLGPCEPLIPLFMVPAAESSRLGVVVVSAVFAAATLSAMLLTVAVGHRGLSRLPLHGLERYAHALAGAAILLSGLGVQLV